MLVSAEHERRGVKLDASSVWVEEVTSTSFDICARELQNFYGAHQSIHIVSISVVYCAITEIRAKTQSKHFSTHYYIKVILSLRGIHDLIIHS